MLCLNAVNVHTHTASNFNSILQVANYVSILDKDLGDRKRTAEVDVGALLRSSYSEYLMLETEKRLKSVPVAFYPAPPNQLFQDAAKVDFPGWVC